MSVALCVYTVQRRFADDRKISAADGGTLHTHALKLTHTHTGTNLLLVLVLLLSLRLSLKVAQME